MDAMNELLKKLSEIGVVGGLHVLAALLVFFIGRRIARLVSRMIGRSCERAQIEPTLTIFLRNISYYALLAFVVITALGQVGIQTTSFVAIIGAAGLAIGLALQGSLSNFAAGVLIILFRPFRSGDFIEAAGTKGTVQEIQIFTTVLEHTDGRRLIVPNASIMGA